MGNSVDEGLGKEEFESKNVSSTYHRSVSRRGHEQVDSETAGILPWCQQTRPQRRKAKSWGYNLFVSKLGHKEIDPETVWIPPQCHCTRAPRKREDTTAASELSATKNLTRNPEDDTRNLNPKPSARGWLEVSNSRILSLGFRVESVEFGFRVDGSWLEEFRA